MMKQSVDVEMETKLSSLEIKKWHGGGERERERERERE